MKSGCTKHRPKVTLKKPLPGLKKIRQSFPALINFL